MSSVVPSYFQDPSYGGGPSESTSEIGVWEDRREQAQRDRKRYEPVWALCQAFIANKQWVGWSKRERRIVSEPNPQDRERHTVNVLTSYLMTNVGKFVSDDLMPRLFFRSDGEEAQAFARAANGGLEYCWDEELEADSQIYDAILRMCSFGLSAIMPGWDATSGPMIAESVPYVDGKPILDPGERAKYMDNNAFQGKIDFRPVRGRCQWRVLSPQNLLPPPGINHERDFPWLIVERPVPIQKLKDVFGDKAEGISEQNLAAVDMLGLRDVVTDSDGTSGTTGRLRGHAVVYTGYEMPSRKHPRGQTVTFASQKILHVEDRLPYIISGEPHIGMRFFKYNIVPERFWPIGLVEPGIGPQRQRNRSRSQYIEMKDRAGLGRVYGRPGSIQVEQLKGGKIFDFIAVRPGAEIPTETTGVGPGPWMAQDIAMHDSDLDKVMGVGQVTLGNSPGAGSPYSGMALLAEQDDKRIGQIMKQNRINVAWLAKFTLDDMRTYWPTDKMIVLSGETGVTDAFIFNASKMPSDVYVSVGTGAPAPRNQAAEIQKVFDIYDRCIAGGQALPREWLYNSIKAGKPLPLPDTPGDVQRQLADLENMMLGKGAAVHVNETDDHAIHKEEHTIARTHYILIPEAADVVRAIDEHIAEHDAAVKQQQTPGTTAPGLQGGFGSQGGPASGQGMPGLPPPFPQQAQAPPPGPPPGAQPPS